MPELSSVQIESSGRVLVYGRDEIALEAGRLLKDYLDVTVLIKPPAVIADQGAIGFPVWTGRVTAAKGHFGSFDLVIDDFLESPRAADGLLPYGLPRNAAQSR